MRLILGLTFLVGIGFNQLQAAPDCQASYHFTNRSGDIAQQNQVLINSLPGNSPVFDNRVTNCQAWALSYNSEGFSGVSIALQDAPASYSSGPAAGTFVTFAGTTISGSNPLSATTSGSYSATGYYPYIRVALTSVTGTGSIDATIVGYKSTSYFGLINGPILTASSCTSTASPAVCGTSSTGQSTIAAAATTKVINTTAVTANSQIFVVEDQSLGTLLSVTCNTQALTTLGTPRITARTAGTSFTVGIDVGPTTNPMCFSYMIIN